MNTKKLGTLLRILPLFFVYLLLAPERGEQPFTFAVIGDYGSGTINEAAVANQVHGWNPDFVITVGDNNYPDGAASTIARNITRDYGQYVTSSLVTNRFWPTLGNHDYGTNNGAPYLNYFNLPGNEKYYDLDYGPVRLWAVDSTKWNLTQQAWLQAGLASSEACFDIVYFHHAPYSSGKHGGASKMRLPFAAWGAEMVMAGHDHDYERLQVDGIPYFVNGLGGKSKYPWGSPPLTGTAVTQYRYNSDFGAMKVTYDAGTLTTQFITRTGVVKDTFQLQEACDMAPLIGEFISPTTAVNVGMVHPGTIRMTNSTHFESSDINSAAFHHVTPEGDNRALVVLATYKDTEGINIYEWGNVGTFGSGDGQFNQPYGIAVAPDGSVYVTEDNNKRVQKFTADGTFILKWGSSGTGNGQFDEARGIAISPDGTLVYVVDNDNNRVQIFDADGVYIDQWGSIGSGNGEFNEPIHIATGPDGSVYVVDHDNNRVQKFDPDGVYITQWGSAPGDGQMTLPTGIAVSPDGERVYVMDNGTDSRKVQVYDSDGVYITQWGSIGSGNGQFVSPVALAVGPDGSVYALDSLKYVQKFDPDGAFLGKWGGLGNGQGQFRNPQGIATAPDGTIYIAEYDNNRVQGFSPLLRINAAHYGDEVMDVGALSDSGSYFGAIYILENPPVGDYEVSLTAPTEPDVILMTAISFDGVETATVDYTLLDSGRAEQETNTTSLQVSHSRAYPTHTLSIWSLLYETAGTTLTAATSNYHWATRNVGNVTNSIGFRPIPQAISSNLSFGATVSPAVGPRVTAVLHLEAVRGHMDGIFLGPILTLYQGSIVRSGDYLLGATISPTTTLFPGSVKFMLTGVAIESTELYEGVLAEVPEPQFIGGNFLNTYSPKAFNGAFINSTALFAGSVLLVLTGVSIASTALYEGVLDHVAKPNVGVFAGTISTT